MADIFMSYSYFAIPVFILSEQTKTLFSGYQHAKFSNDGLFVLLPAYNSNRQLVHDTPTILGWLQFEPDPQQTLDNILTQSVEFTKSQIQAAKQDPNSNWYEGE